MKSRKTNTEKGQCVYKKFTPEEYKNIPEGTCIKYKCDKQDSLLEGVVCSYQYDHSNMPLLKVLDEAGSSKFLSGRPVWVQKKKKKPDPSEYTLEAVQREILQEELRKTRADVAKLKKNVADLTTAIKLMKSAYSENKRL